MKIPKTMRKAQAVWLIICLIFISVGCEKSNADTSYANSLSDKISFVPFFKGGDICYYKDGAVITVAPGAYDTESDSPIYSADYAIDKSSGKMLYMSQGALYLYDGQSALIAENVTAWRASSGLERFIFTTPWRENIDSSLGTLFLYNNGEIVLLDTGVTTSSIRLESSCAYALKPNIYPKTRSKLIKYDFSGGFEVMASSRPTIMWANDETVITAESSDGKVYTYYLDNSAKSVTAQEVYYPSVCGSKLYLLEGYSSGKGKLCVYDLKTLKRTVLAVGVAFFSTENVTNPQKGVTYTVLDDAEKEYYSVYYCTLKGKSTRILRNTSESGLYNMALNNDTCTGFIYSSGTADVNSAVYFIDFSNEVKSTRLASGAVGALCYYERENKALFVKTDGSGAGAVFVSDGKTTLELCSDCAVEDTSGGCKAQCVLNKNGDSVLYFASDGTLKLSGGAVISENAANGYGLSPITDSAFGEVYYLEENASGSYDFYVFNGETALIASSVDAIFSVSE